MQNAIMLVGVTVSISIQSILKKMHNERAGGIGAFTFSAVSVLTAAIFFIFSSGFKFDFNLETLPYSIGFALSYGTAVVMSFLAIRAGSLSLTSLVTSYSLIIPTFFGIIFLDETVGALFYVGFALLAVSIFLMNSKRSEVRITPLWIVLVFLAFLGNGICSTVQNLHQRTFGGLYKSEMMITALVIVVVILIPIVALTERRELVPSLKRGWFLMAACGLINGACNLLVMILSVRMNSSIMFPIISAGGIIITGVVSRFLYKEHLSLKQYAALTLGTVSVVLMNI